MKSDGPTGALNGFPVFLGLFNAVITTSIGAGEDSIARVMSDSSRGVPSTIVRPVWGVRAEGLRTRAVTEWPSESASVRI